MGYWQERQEAMYKAGEMQVNKYFTRLEKAFNQTRRELQKTIEAFCFRYAKENGLSFAAAQKKLDAEELGELQDFIDLAMANIGRYNQMVNNMSIKARITRYQALEAQVDAILRQLYAIDYEADAEKTMQEIYEGTYYRTWYSIDQYHGFHAEFAQVSPTVVEKLLEYPFNGAAFSSRIWKQKDHLQAQLMEAVTTMLIQGKHPSTLTKEFAKKMQSKKFDAYRLLHTESSFLMSEATHAGYKEDGVPKYEILATLDSKTCNVCGELDNKVYEVGKEVIGVNMPPFHPLCRCTTVPHYDDTPTEGLTRVARNPETGKTYEVPANMSWKEWKKKYVELKHPVVKVPDSGIIKLTDTDQYALNQYVSFDFYPINEKLRNGTPLTERESNMVEQLDSALQKMPLHRGDLSRSLYFGGDRDAIKECLNKFPVGEEICFKEFLSTTCGTELYNPDGEIQIFVENSRKGRDITNINSMEMEVLYERKSKFKVINVTEKAEKHWILLREG